MVQYIAHRQNKLKNLKHLTKLSFSGIELDLRSSLKEIIIHHDPFKKGIVFFKKINILKDLFLLIDIKSAGIGLSVIKFLLKRKLKFLILNLSQPELIEMINKGYGKNLFLRYSFYEKIDFSQKKMNKVKWIWVDFFDHYKMSLKDYKYLKKLNKKICIASPELVGASRKTIKDYIHYLNKNKIQIDMLCVKQENIETWKKLYNYS